MDNKGKFSAEFDPELNRLKRRRKGMIGRLASQEVLLEHTKNYPHCFEKHFVKVKK